jgi:hypothetical protein
MGERGIEGARTHGIRPARHHEETRVGGNGHHAEQNRRLSDSDLPSRLGGEGDAEEKDGHET